MPDTIDILIKSIFDAAGTNAATKAIGAVSAAAKGASAAKPIADVGAAAAKAERDILRYSASMAQAQRATGDAAGAVQTWRSALSQMTPNTIEAHRATTGLAQAQTALQKELSGTASYAQQVGQSVASSLTSMIGPAAAAGAAIKAIQVGVDLAQIGAQAEQTRTRFDQLAVQAGTTGDAMLAALRKASAGTISDTALQLSAMKASLLGVAQNADQLGPILAIARDRAQQMGISVEFAFDSLVTGLGRGSRLILDNVGVIVKAGDANAAYAAQIGKAVGELTEQEQKQALINEVIRQGNETIAATGGAVETAVTSQQRLAAAFSNTKDKLGALIADMSVGFVEGASDILNATDGTAESIGNATVALSNFSRSFQGLGPLTTTEATSLRDTATAALQSTAAYGDREAAIYGVTAASQQATAANDQNTAATTQNAAAQTQVAAATLIAADADDRRTAAALTAGQATQTSADASLLDAANKERQSAQIAVLEFQTKAAADAFLALNPNITAAGAASAYAAGQISIAVNAYIQTALATARARAELANLQAQAGMSPVLKAAATAAGGGDVGRYIMTPADPGAKADAAAKVARLKQLEQQERDRSAAAKELELARSTAAQKVAIRQKEYDDDARIYGKGSTQALKAETDLVQAQQSVTRAGGAGRASAATQGAERLATIEQNAGNKLADIDQKTQDKLIAIDEKAAEARLAAWQRLNEAIATSEADRRAQNEADDLELIGIKDKNKARELNNREKAEATARASEQAAAAEARSTAEAGEAEAAGKIYDIREKQIDQQQALDEKYYARQAELAGDPKSLEALQTQYDEATRAINEAADTRIAIEQNAAEQRKAVVQAEKDAVIAAAEDEKNQVIGRAQQSAEGVKKASGDARAKAVSDLQAIGSAVNAIPTSKTITITTVQQTSSTAGGAGATKSAGGGTFLTHGPTTITVGDNPGGVEAVHVVPVSGVGTTTVGAGMTRLGAGGTVIDAGSGYTTPIAGAGGSPGSSPGSKGIGGAKPIDVTAATKQLNDQIAFLKATAELAYLLKSPIPSIDTTAMQALADESKRIGSIVGHQLVPISKDNMKLLDDYGKAVSGSISILSGVQGLRKDLAEPEPPISAAYAQALAQDSLVAGKAIGAMLVPISQTALMELEDYEKAVSGAVGVLKDVQDVRKQLTEPQPPLDPAYLYRLAIDTQRASGVIASLLVPYSKEQVDQMDRYEQAVGASVGVFKDVSELSSKMFEDYTSPTDAQIGMVARDAQRVTRAMVTAATTFDTKGLEAAKLYNEAVGGTFANIKDGLLAAQALNSGDFVLDPAKLAQFEAATVKTLGVTKRLGALASTIPASDITALQTTTAALSAQAEAMIKLAAVPFGDIMAGAAGLAQNSGALLGKTGGTTINNTFNLPQGTMQQLAQEVIKILNTQTGARR